MRPHAVVLQMANLRCPVFPPWAFLAVLLSSISLSRLHLGVWSQALAEVGFLIRASCHHLDRGRPPGWDSSARGLGRHCFSSWPVGAGSEPLWCSPHVPPHAMAPCLPHLQRTGAHRDTRWGLGLHSQGPAESPGSHRLGAQLLTELRLVPLPAGQVHRFLPHLGHPKRAGTVLSHDMLQRVLTATRGSGGHP